MPNRASTYIETVGSSFPGDWLGLEFQKEEHYKLARIQVDLSNASDDEWDIDVRKSRARPPLRLRDDLLRIARATRMARRGGVQTSGQDHSAQFAERSGLCVVAPLSGWANILRREHGTIP